MTKDIKSRDTYNYSEISDKETVETDSVSIVNFMIRGQQAGVFSEINPLRSGSIESEILSTGRTFHDLSEGELIDMLRSYGAVKLTGER